MKSVLSLSLILLAGCSTVPESETDHLRRQAKAYNDPINDLDPATIYQQRPFNNGQLLELAPPYSNSKYMFRHVH